MCRFRRLAGSVVLIIAVAAEASIRAQVLSAAPADMAPAALAARNAPAPLVVTEPPYKLKWKLKNLGQAKYSSLALDASGNPHVVFAREVGGTRVLTHAWATGTHWSSEVIDADDEHSFGYANSIAIDAEGGVHVACATEVLGQGWELEYGQRTATGWETELIEPGGQSSSIAVDDQGVVHMVHVNGGMTSEVRYVRKTPTGWEFETIDPSGSWFSGTTLILRDGKVYATYTGEGLELAVRDAGIWTKEEIDSGDNGSVAFDARGVLHVAYASGVELRHAWVGAGGWEYETLSTASQFFGESLPPELNCIVDAPALVADASGRLQLAGRLAIYKGKAGAEALFEFAFDGVAWSPSLVKAKPIGFDNSIAVDARGIVHMSTARQSENSPRIYSVRLQGARLSLAVVPQGAGTVTVSPDGTPCSDKTKLSFYPGDVASLSAAPADGFVFTGWTGAASGSNLDASVPMVKNLKVVAHFAPAP